MAGTIQHPLGFRALTGMHCSPAARAYPNRSRW